MLVRRLSGCVSSPFPLPPCPGAWPGTQGIVTLGKAAPEPLVSVEMSTRFLSPA